MEDERKKTRLGKVIVKLIGIEGDSLGLDKLDFVRVFCCVTFFSLYMLQVGCFSIILGI